MDPADPHNLHDTADHAILETIQIGAEGSDLHGSAKQLREALTHTAGVQDVKVDEDAQAIFVTFDARKIQNAGVHEAIERSGYKAGRFAE